MFSPKYLQKLKAELFQSLQVEYKEIKKELPKNLLERSNIVYNKYLETNSIAGLEQVVISISEYHYFNDLKNELNSIKNADELIIFYEEIIDTLKSDFGNEDYRFTEWERTKPEIKKLNEIIDSWINSSILIFTDINEHWLLTEVPNYEFYYKTNDPSLQGLNVKLKKTKTPKDKIQQIYDAEEYLSFFWKEGYDRYKILTDKIILVKSKDMVSYTHFNEQGISYYNLLDRDILEFIDDLVHENAHHHLNILLKKFKLIGKEFNEEVFYSPWRKVLRPLYGILHAVFTFSFGCELFKKIIESKNFADTNLDSSILDRAKFRFVEETLYNQYSFVDLEWGIKHKIFTPKGIKLIQDLKKMNDKALKDIGKVESGIKSKELKNKIKEIKVLLKSKRDEFKIKY